MKSVAVAGIILFGATSTWATTILNTNFDSANGTYSDGSVINSSGASTEQLSVKMTNTDSSLKVVSGKLQFTDNSNVSNSVDGGPSIIKTFSGVGTSAGQDSRLTIEFDLTYLIDPTTASKPALQMLLNNNSTALSNSTTAINLVISTGAAIYYQDGQSSSFTSSTLSQNTEYHFKIDLDLTTGKWSLLVTNGASEFLNKTNISTRAPMTGFTPSTFLMNGGSNTANKNDSPYVQIDNLSIVSSPAAVPEPATATLLSLSSLALMARKATR